MASDSAKEPEARANVQGPAHKARGHMAKHMTRNRERAPKKGAMPDFFYKVGFY